MNRGRFDRDRLPRPVDYFERVGLRLIGHGLWRGARCPFHEDTHPSFSVNTQSGGYICHACGARGGDVLDFHRARYGLSFLQAARDLGALR